MKRSAKLELCVGLLCRIPLRKRLSLGLLVVVLISGLTTTFVAVHFINAAVIGQAQDKVRLDLNTARQVYEQSVHELVTLLRFTAIRPSLREAMAGGDAGRLGAILDSVYGESGVDVLGVTDTALRVVYRSNAPGASGDSQEGNAVVAGAWTRGEAVGGTVVVPREALVLEGAKLAERAASGRASADSGEAASGPGPGSGMFVMAAAPVLSTSGEAVGVVYAGRLLNRDEAIVDAIRDTVYQGKFHGGAVVGASTIFMGDIRIATNVLTADGARAVGTRVSRAVYEKVLVAGEPWVDRAFVVNDWYISAYEPIVDVSGDRAGMLYVGMLEQPFDDLRAQVVWTLLAMTGLGIGLALVAAFLLSRSILVPVARLSQGARRLADGDLDYHIEAVTHDEIGQVSEAFNQMVEHLRDRDRQIWENTQRRLTESEKMASLGELAAGVAHEINNPLTGVLTFSTLLLQDEALPPAVKADMGIIVEQTTRCRDIVRNLLDFARETKPEFKECDVSLIVWRVVKLVQHQNAFLNIEIDMELGDHVPLISADPSQLQQVVLNLVLNAAEAMPDGGSVYVATRYRPGERQVTVTVKDMGMGISEADLERIFDPFFSTKPQGRGTGLGLAVSYGIVRAHNGTITVTSQPGKGSTFEVNLPVPEDA